MKESDKGVFCSFLRDDKSRMPLLILFFLGFLFGMILKTQASKLVTMGYDDYKVSKFEDDFYNQVNLEEVKDLQAEEENLNLKEGDSESVEDVEVKMKDE